MTTAPATADNEAGRLAALDRFDILDTEAEPAFDRAASLAAHIFRTPIAVVSFLDRERQWHKSRIGIESSEMPRALTLCDETIGSSSVLLATDLRHDARFADKAAVRQQGVRFYAGAPVVTHDGYAIGTICVMDYEPRPDIGAEDAQCLMQLADMVLGALELRLAKRQLTSEHSSRGLAENRLKLLNDLTEAALEAPDFKTAIGGCLHIIAGHVGADCAVAYGLRPNATRLELEAEYTAPGLDADAFLDFLRRFPMHGDNSLTEEAVLHQRLVAVADLSS